MAGKAANGDVVAIAAAYEMAPGRFPELSTEDLFRKVLKVATAGGQNF